MTIKIAHLADTHLGYRQYGILDRELDYYDTFDNIIDDIIAHDVDYVIHCGDLFEQAKPPIKALLCAQKGFLKLIENDIKIVVIAGNHDIRRSKGTSIPQELYENESFTILTLDENYYEINEDIIIAGLPYVQKSYEDVVKDMLYEIYDHVKEYKHKILMLHGGTSKHFDFNPEFELDTIPEGFDYYAMGHIHKRIIEKDFRKGILSYPGSSDIKEKGEISDYKEKHKGYNLVTIDDEIKVEYVDVPLEREFIVRRIKYPELDKRLDEVENYIRNEILTESEKKPVLILSVNEGDFDRTAVTQKVKKKLDDITLTIRLTCNPTEIKGPDRPIEDELTPENLILEHLKTKFENEKIANLGLDLYNALSTKNIEEAEEISKEFYHNRYVEEEVEKDDNS